MASAWANALPRVTVPDGTTPKRVTFVLPFYENHKFLWDQVAKWHEYASSLRWHLSAVIVDDGSPSPARLPKMLPFPIQLFRIEVDWPWNWLAARNIGAHHADDGWMLLTDMDHVVPELTAEALVIGQHDPSVVYAFERVEHTGEVITPHSASFFMTKAMFWKIGGYDEALSGHYGTDGEYRRRLQQHAPIHVLPQNLVRYEHVADSSTSRYRRKMPEDAAAVKQIIASRGPNWTPKTLSFPYHEVMVTEAVGA